MSLPKGLKIVNSYSSLLKAGIAIVVAAVGLYFSFSIDTSFAFSSALLWFVLFSQAIYVIIFLLASAKLVRIFFKRRINNNNFVKAAAMLDKFDENKVLENNNIVINKKTTLGNNIFKNRDLEVEPLATNAESTIISANNQFPKSVKEISTPAYAVNFQDNYYNNNSPLYLNSEFYELIPMPLIVTNKEGLILNYNQLAQDFFNDNLKDNNINKFINPLETKNLQGVVLVKVQLQLGQKKDLIAHLLQTTIFESNNTIKAVILFFLPNIFGSNDLEQPSKQTILEKTTDKAISSLLNNQAFITEEAATANLITKTNNRTIDNSNVNMATENNIERLTAAPTNLYSNSKEEMEMNNNISSYLVNKTINSNASAEYTLANLSNMLAAAIIVLNNKQEIITFNHQACLLLQDKLNIPKSNNDIKNLKAGNVKALSLKPNNQELNAITVTTSNNNQPHKLNGSQSFVGNNFKTLFNDVLTSEQITNILNKPNGKEQISLAKDNIIEFYFSNNENLTVITLQDISEKKKLELQSSFSQRLQTVGQIASAVAHDFNNLLTAIMSFTYFLRERYSAEDPSSLELEQIEQNANRAKVMIRQLLTFSRGKELNPITFLVNSEVSNLMSTILRLMGEKIKTEFIRGKNIGKITMDQVQFQQVIINLVVNARDSMKNGGNLTIITSLVKLTKAQEGAITTIPPGEYVVISIKDQGEGIALENFKKIFQTHFSTKGDKGNGLGLSTVAKIMQENNGFIALESTLKQGTTFHLYFHAEETFGEQTTEDTKIELPLTINSITTKDIAVDLTGSGTILLVEDEIPVRTVCKRALVSKGYEVIEAEDAETALTLLQNLTNKVDLIISDVMMPGISGLELIAKAKEIKPELKAILMSGYAEDTLEDNHYALDSIEFLAKPFNPNVLATKVKKVISS